MRKQDRSGSRRRGLDRTPARVVVCEKDPSARDLLVDMLRTQGHEVVAFSHGADLMDFVEASARPTRRRCRADLIISDAHLPGMTEIEALAILRGIDGVTPMILVTGFKDHSAHQRAHKLGATAVFEKGFDDLTALRSLIAGLLEASGR